MAPFYGMTVLPTCLRSGEMGETAIGNQTGWPAAVTPRLIYSNFFSAEELLTFAVVSLLKSAESMLAAT